MTLSGVLRQFPNPLKYAVNMQMVAARGLRFMSTSPTHQAMKLAEDEYIPGKWNTFKQNAFGFFRKKRYSRYKLAVAGENMYTLCAEYPNYSDFVARLKLPDSYQTWFTITALHVWLCLVRLRDEDIEGRFVREIMFKTFFEDIEKRTRGFRVADKARDVSILQKQLYGALFAYDEGLLSNEDRILAASLWRDFFLMKAGTDADDLELMVSYVRKQLQYLDNQSSDQLFKIGYVKFLPLVGDKEDKVFINERLKFALSIPSLKEIEEARQRNINDES